MNLKRILIGLKSSKLQRNIFWTPVSIYQLLSWTLQILWEKLFPVTHPKLCISLQRVTNWSLTKVSICSCLSAYTSRKDEFLGWRNGRNHNKPHQSAPLHWHNQHIFRDRDGRGEVCRCLLNQHTVCPSKWRSWSFSDSFTATTYHASRTVTENFGRLSQEGFEIK